jgi:putative transposase
MQKYALEYPQYLTATIQHWKNLLHKAQYKQIIIDALKYLHVQQKVSVYGFVIMGNHIRIIWQSKGKTVSNKFKPVL